MSVTELVVFFALGSALMLLYYILRALDRIHATLVDLHSDLKKQTEKSD
jgi:hypothetical protein